jgi:hypothetical protein
LWNLTSQWNSLFHSTFLFVFFCIFHFSTSGSPAMLVKMLHTPAKADVPMTVTQSTACIIATVGIMATAVWHMVFNALMPAACHHFLFFNIFSRPLLPFQTFHMVYSMMEGVMGSCDSGACIFLC